MVDMRHVEAKVEAGVAGTSGVRGEMRHVRSERKGALKTLLRTILRKRG